MSAQYKKYLPRLIDPVVEQHLEAFGAVEIAGTMWSGKSWTSNAHGESGVNLDDPKDFRRAEISPAEILEGENPRVIDEWQRVPEIWDAARLTIDKADGKRGLFILTGSSRPSKSKVHHSGSGRISRLRMWPLSSQEKGFSSGKVSLSALFEGSFTPTETSMKLKDLAEEVYLGGWPGALGLPPKTSTLIPAQYLDTLFSSEDDNAPEPEATLRRFAQALARNIGGAVTIETLAKDMQFLTGDGVTETGRRRVRNLLAYFEGRFVIDPMTGWDAPIKSPERLRTKPRYDFADPSLAAQMLGTSPEMLMKNTQIFGQLFEQLALRDLRVYTSVMDNVAPGALRYYRDADGLEVDAIIERRDSSWAGIEIKLGDNKAQDGIASLLRLKEKISLNTAAQNPEPLFLMVLVGHGKYAYRDESGVFVVPITCLGA